MAKLTLPHLMPGPVTDVEVRVQRICSGWHGLFWVLLFLTAEEEDELRLPLGYAVHRLTTESAYIYQLRELSTEHSYRVRMSGELFSYDWQPMTLVLGVGEDIEMPVNSSGDAVAEKLAYLKIHVELSESYFLRSRDFTAMAFSRYQNELNQWTFLERIEHLLSYQSHSVTVYSTLPNLSHGWNRLRQTFVGPVTPSPKKTKRRMRIDRPVSGKFRPRDWIEISDVGGNDEEVSAVLFGFDAENRNIFRYATSYVKFDETTGAWTSRLDINHLDWLRESTDLTTYTYKHMLWIDPTPMLLCHLSHKTWRFLAILPARLVYGEDGWAGNVTHGMYAIGVRVDHKDLLHEEVEFPGLCEDLQERVNKSYKMGMALSHCLNELKYQVTLRKDPLYFDLQKDKLPNGHMVGTTGRDGNHSPWPVNVQISEGQPVAWRMRYMVRTMWWRLHDGGEKQLLERGPDLHPVAQQAVRKRRLDL